MRLIRLVDANTKPLYGYKIILHIKVSMLVSCWLLFIFMAEKPYYRLIILRVRSVLE